MDKTDSINPNLVNPPIGIDEGVKMKRTTRSQIGGMKGSTRDAKIANKSVHVSFKKGDLNMGNKGVKLRRGLR